MLVIPHRVVCDSSSSTGACAWWVDCRLACVDGMFEGRSTIVFKPQLCGLQKMSGAHPHECVKSWLVFRFFVDLSVLTFSRSIGIAR